MTKQQQIKNTFGKLHGQNENTCILRNNNIKQTTVVWIFLQNPNMYVCEHQPNNTKKQVGERNTNLLRL